MSSCRSWLHLIHYFLVGSSRMIFGLSPAWTCPVPSVCLHRTCVPVPPPHRGSSNSFHVIPCTSSSRLYTCDLMTAAEKGIITSLNQPAMLLLIHSGILLAAFAPGHWAAAHQNPTRRAAPWPDTDQSVVLLPRVFPIQAHDLVCGLEFQWISWISFRIWMALGSCCLFPPVGLGASAWQSWLRACGQAAISGCDDKTVLSLLQVTDKDGREVETRWTSRSLAAQTIPQLETGQVPGQTLVGFHWVQDLTTTFWANHPNLFYPPDCPPIQTLTSQQGVKFSGCVFTAHEPLHLSPCPLLLHDNNHGVRDTLHIHV